MRRVGFERSAAAGNSVKIVTAMRSLGLLFAAAVLIVTLEGCGGGGSRSEVGSTPTPTPLHTGTPVVTATPGPLANTWAVGSVTFTTEGVPDEHVILRSFDEGVTWSETFRSDLRLSGVSFADRRTGWAVGGEQILRSTDSGASWVSQRTNVPADRIGAVAVIARSPAYAIVVGGGGFNPFGWPALILTTRDGGETWSVTPITPDGGGALQPDMPALRGVCVTESEVAIAVGHAISPVRGIVVRSTNGGATWTDITNLVVSGVSSGILVYPKAVACTGHDFWIVDSGQQAVLHSADDGTTWEDRTANVAESGLVSFLDVAFASPSVGFVVGATAEGRPSVIGTVNGGRRWERRPVSGADGAGLLLALALAAPEIGTAVGLRGSEGDPERSLTLTTADGGDSWTATTTRTDAQILRDVTRQP